ncbi:hypothetical protein Taro_028262 [Colocasia esculenta]|uniref:Uncharacterized protein n=1 Tax=Colocasia esculenta TaxID=4460 RepID=A0A843VML8_COLES|nr:hypothetical protein [Colocasia esculenta]
MFHLCGYSLNFGLNFGNYMNTLERGAVVGITFSPPFNSTPDSNLSESREGAVSAQTEEDKRLLRSPSALAAFAFLSSFLLPPSEPLWQLRPFCGRMVELLFEDIFTLTKLDPDGKKFDKVSRIVAHSEQFDMDMQLDVNTEVYPMRVGDKFTTVLAPTLNLDGTPDTGYFMQGGRKSLADKFEYVMHGKLYKISDEGSGPNVKVEIYASFGGLLMMLKGDPSNVANFDLNQRLFLLIRKV